MSNLYFTDSHEWVKIDREFAVVGVTDFAQHNLGDIVYVDLPELDDNISKGDECVVLESVKSASDVYSPLSGTIVEINTALNDNPQLINTSPYENGWIYKIKVSDSKEIESLISERDYEELCKKESHH